MKSAGWLSSLVHGTKHPLPFAWYGFPMYHTRVLSTWYSCCLSVATGLTLSYQLSQCTLIIPVWYVCGRQPMSLLLLGVLTPVQQTSYTWYGRGHTAVQQRSIKGGPPPPPPPPSSNKQELTNVVTSVEAAMVLIVDPSSPLLGLARAASLLVRVRSNFRVPIKNYVRYPSTRYFIYTNILVLVIINVRRPVFRVTSRSRQKLRYLI